MGQIWRFPKNAATTQSQVVKVLEWASNTQVGGDQGFYSIAFHPEFGQAGSLNANYAYVCYSHKPALTGADENHSLWRVSRFTWIPASGILDPNSEFVLISQYDRCSWHNGGAMYFDNQGFLNITAGDGGHSDAGDGLRGADGALSRTQRLNFGIFSSIFRIDVNNDSTKSHPIRRQPLSPTNKPASFPASFTQGYGIPNDNPFLDPSGSILEEYFALGLRSPHTAHYDKVAGEVWVGDVGMDEREEIGVLLKGGNGQWGYGEGKAGGPGYLPTTPIGINTPPLIDYNHNTGGNCIIGGMRYRGAKWNSLLNGKLLYADRGRRKVWAATINEPGREPVIEQILDGFPARYEVGIANFCTDTEGEIYIMNLNGLNNPDGTILKLVTAGISAEPPSLLSQTGIFTNLSTLSTAPGLVPYRTVNPLFSDAAAKKRWIILPNNGTHDTPSEDITFDEKENWVFPPGTVFVKHFEVVINENNPTLIKRLETRFLICSEGGGKYGLTYRWNEAGTDAQLLTSGQIEDFTITLQNGTTAPRRWEYPSRSDCMLCHTTAAGQALGVKTASLNEKIYYESTGRTANQLATFNALGMFDRTLSVTELENFLEARNISDATAPLEHRVRSYIDMNCSHCHRPGSSVDYFDARLSTSLTLQGLINSTIKGHYHELEADGRYLKPGNPNLSALYVRMNNVGNGSAMPPIAKNLVDTKAVEVFRNYLLGLTDTEFQLIPSPSARYVRITANSEVNNNAWTAIAEFSILDDNGVAIPTSALSIYGVDSEEVINGYAPASNAIDGNTSTAWHTKWWNGEAAIPHYMTVDIGSLRPIGGFIYNLVKIWQMGVLQIIKYTTALMELTGLS
jgi:glucose/arabinose dehydrogenase